MAAARDLAGAVIPLSLRDLEQEIGERLRRIPTHLNEYGFDPFGLHPETARHVMANVIAHVEATRQSLLLITHDLQGLEHLDRTLVMEAGRVVSA